MGKTEKDLNGWEFGFLKAAQAYSFSKFITVVGNLNFVY